MKTANKHLIICIFSFACLAAGQDGVRTPRDGWDRQFHPREFAKKADANWQGWLAQHAEKLLSPLDVLEFWKLRLYEPTAATITDDWQKILWSSQRIVEKVLRDAEVNYGPARFDAAMNARADGQRDAIQQKLNVFAMDIADDLNIKCLTKAGRIDEAAAIAKAGADREQKRQESEERRAIIAGQARLNAEISDMRQQIQDAEFFRGQAEEQIQRQLRQLKR